MKSNGILGYNKSICRLALLFLGAVSIPAHSQVTWIDQSDRLSFTETDIAYYRTEPDSPVRAIPGADVPKNMIWPNKIQLFEAGLSIVNSTIRSAVWLSPTKVFVPGVEPPSSRFGSHLLDMKTKTTNKLFLNGIAGLGQYQGKELVYVKEVENPDVFNSKTIQYVMAERDGIVQKTIFKEKIYQGAEFDYTFCENEIQEEKKRAATKYSAEEGVQVRGTCISETTVDIWIAKYPSLNSIRPEKVLEKFRRTKEKADIPRKYIQAMPYDSKFDFYTKEMIFVAKGGSGMFLQDGYFYRWVVDPLTSDVIAKSMTVNRIGTVDPRWMTPSKIGAITMVNSDIGKGSPVWWIINNGGEYILGTWGNTIRDISVGPDGCWAVAQGPYGKWNRQIDKLEPEKYKLVSSYYILKLCE